MARFLGIIVFRMKQNHSVNLYPQIVIDCYTHCFKSLRMYNKLSTPCWKSKHQRINHDLIYRWIKFITLEINFTHFGLLFTGCQLCFRILQTKKPYKWWGLLMPVFIYIAATSFIVTSLIIKSLSMNLWDLFKSSTTLKEDKLQFRRITFQEPKCCSLPNTAELFLVDEDLTALDTLFDTVALEIFLYRFLLLLLWHSLCLKLPFLFTNFP